MEGGQLCKGDVKTVPTIVHMDTNFSNVYIYIDITTVKCFGILYRLVFQRF